MVRHYTTLLVPLVVLSGCYGAAPPRPEPVPLPQVEGAAPITVHSESKTRYENVQKQAETCPQGHASGSQACTRTTYTVKEPVTRTKTTAMHGDKPLNYAQFKVLTDPDYDAKLSRLDDHSEACQQANIPRYIGMGLAIGGGLAYAFGANNDAVRTVGLIGVGGGIGSYAAGYFAFGGRRCNEARAVYNQVNHAPLQNITTVSGSVTAEEMKALAEDFNARISTSVAGQ